MEFNESYLHLEGGRTDLPGDTALPHFKARFLADVLSPWHIQQLVQTSFVRLKDHITLIPIF
jgi:hypothetical protein